MPQELWTDLLALTGMATICDMVPLNAVNHKLAKMGIRALTRSQRPILRALRAACRSDRDLDESDVGFRLGPRINAVGRLDHADVVIKAFSEEDPAALIEHMDNCNTERKEIQRSIVKQAQQAATEQQGQHCCLSAEISIPACLALPRVGLPKISGVRRFCSTIAARCAKVRHEPLPASMSPQR